MFQKIIGCKFTYIFFLFGYDIARFFITIDPKTAGPVIIALVSILVIYGMINAQFIRIRTLRITSNKLRKELKIVHISDLHIGAVHGTGYLKKIVKLVKAQKPDLVLITGDLVDGPQHYSKKTFTSFDELSTPIYFSTGNHGNIG